MAKDSIIMLSITAFRVRGSLNSFSRLTKESLLLSSQYSVHRFPMFISEFRTFRIDEIFSSWRMIFSRFISCFSEIGLSLVWIRIGDSLRGAGVPKREKSGKMGLWERFGISLGDLEASFIMEGSLFSRFLSKERSWIVDRRGDLGVMIRFDKFILGL